MFYTVIGTQWGDEGKGKIVDWLSSKVDVVVRFQGGNNAGHTLKIKEKIFKLNLLPSGIIRGKQCIIGNGVILDPWALEEEIQILKKQGIVINSKNLQIAENICLILPLHIILDEINEKNRGEEKLGTTKKGIGPAYEDKIGRRAIRLCDLSDEKLLRKKITNLISFHSVRLIHFDKKINEADLINKLLKVFNKISQYLAPTWKILNDYGKKEKIILFEGAQGALLDIDFGTYPFVTSSNTTAAGACTGLGIAPNKIKDVFGIFKAYTTRVGSGPFPTELFDDYGKTMAKVGNEFGATTGRPRRCGWLDLVALKYAVQVNGVTQLMMMKGDVLSGFDHLNVCTAYKYKGEEIQHLPFNIEAENVTPVYKKMKGWKADLTKMTEASQMPDALNDYINFLEDELEVPIKIVSVGPDRTQTIKR